MNPEFYSVRWYFRRSPAAAGVLIVIAGVIAFTVSKFIVDEDFVGMAYAAMVVAGAVAILAILRNWRNGVYFFLGWLMFEDLARKYLGNNMAITFGKVVLLMVTIAVVYAIYAYLHAYRLDWLGRAYSKLLPVTNELYSLVETYFPDDVKYKIRGAITDDLGQRSLFLLLLTAAVELTLYSLFKFFKYVILGPRRA